MSIFSRMLNGYLKISRCYPYTVQMVQTGILMASGDIIAQQFIEKTNKHDWLRTKQFGAVGFLFVGPTTTLWYRILENFFHKGCMCSQLDRRATQIMGLKKMLSDQIIYAPIFLGTFLLLIGRLKCKKWERNLNDVKTQYKDVLLTNYTIWPFVQLVNFTFVPVHLQVLSVQSVALLWNTYLSWRTAKTENGHNQLYIPDEEKIDSFWCRPKGSQNSKPRCKRNEEPPPIIEEPKKELDIQPILPKPPSEEGKYDEECIPDDMPPSKPPPFKNMNEMFFLFQTACLLSIIYLTFRE